MQLLPKRGAPFSGDRRWWSDSWILDVQNIVLVVHVHVTVLLLISSSWMQFVSAVPVPLIMCRVTHMARRHYLILLHWQSTEHRSCKMPNAKDDRLKKWMSISWVVFATSQSLNYVGRFKIVRVTCHGSVDFAARNDGECGGGGRGFVSQKQQGEALSFPFVALLYCTIPLVNHFSALLVKQTPTATTTFGQILLFLIC